jgi:FAD/FMN-containing dehydrogenase/Fe-S oxidoreductase
MSRTEAGAALEHELRGTTRGRVFTDRVSRILYATDASNYRILPDAVLVAESLEDLQAAVAACRATGIPLTARGGGTSLAGQAVGRGLHVDTFKLESVELDAEARTATVSCGTIRNTLDAAARRRGLTFGPETATANRATIGGMAGNNSAGTRSVVYGMTRDRIEWMEVVLASGTLARFGPAGDGDLAAGISGPGTSERDRLADDLEHIRRAAAVPVARGFPTLLRHVDGYGLDALCEEHPNLARFLAGSEGTLALITRIGVRLDPIPAERALAVFSFAGLDEAIDAVPDLAGRGASAVELLDRHALENAREDVSWMVAPDADAVLFVEFQGDEGEARASVAALAAAGAQSKVVLESGEDQVRAWRIRERGLGAMQAVTPPGTLPAFVDDTAVAPERLPEYVREVRRIVASYGTRAVMFGHASVGCLHIYPLVNIRTAAGIRDMEAMAGEIVDLVADFGGALSGEHGDGLAKSQWLERFLGPELVERFRDVKRAFDPDGLLNPGKIVDPEPMTAGLRYGAGYRAAPHPTPLALPGGVTGATELCFGAGACKKRAGVMCPPAMATREERHSTRARANALRAVLSGELSRGELSGAVMREVMETCISCKACASECPVGVDMASLKADWLWRVRRTEGVPLRARAIADLRRLSRLGSAAPALANALIGSRAGARLAKAVGVAPQRTIPRLAPRRFSRSVPRTRTADAAVFADCFTEFQEPHIGTALVRILRAAGRTVLVPRTGCCGRVALSEGLLDRAKRDARSCADALLPLVEDGLRVLVIEPSCLSMIADDWKRLLPDDPAAGAVAAAAIPAETEIATLPDIWSSLGGPVLLHGHCHQRALWGTGASRRALERVPGTTVEEPDSGCCGMAGAFGYEAEHYELSVAMGERVLAPAIRSRPDDTIVAPGTSCRHQIRDLTGREALHPVQFVARHLR